jgi:GTPase SAR1 family protein
LDTHNIEFKNGSQLEIIDTSGSGQESYDCLADQGIRKASAVLLFYSIDSDSSFRKISDYYARVQSLALDPVVMLIGTKCDVGERQVPLEKGRRLAHEMGVYFQEVSAKKGENTERVLSDLKRLLFGRRWTSILIDMTRLIWNVSSALLTGMSALEKTSADPFTGERQLPEFDGVRFFRMEERGGKMRQAAARDSS